MSNAVAERQPGYVEQVVRLPSIPAGGAVRAIVPQDFEGAWRIASAVCKAGMAPVGLQQPEKAMVAIMHGLEVGLTPMNALQSIAVVNGRPTIYGDGAIGLVRGSGLLEWMEEKFEGEEGKDGFTAVCLLKRRGEPAPTRGEFSIGDARKASLLGKAGPWQQYQKRMLRMRARAFALRDGFADVLKGLSIREEVQDIDARDVRTVQDEPPAPPPSPAVIEHVAETATESEAPQAAAQGVTAEDFRPDKHMPPAPARSDAKAFLQWIDDGCGKLTTGEDLERVWNDEIDPLLGDLFPPDYEDAMSVYRKHEARFAE